MARGKSVTVLARQSIWDLAIQEGGSIDYAEHLMDENPIINMFYAPTAGTIIKTSATPINKEVKAYYDTKQLKPVSIAVVTIVPPKDK
jgi:hypothetical protein